MDVYDSRIFVINKRFLQLIGLWPFDSRRKNIIFRIIILTSMAIMILLQGISLYKNFGRDISQVLFSVYLGVAFAMIALKVLTSITAEKEMTEVYKNIAKKNQTIVNEKEREILFKFGESGRLITIVFIGYMAFAVNVYSIVPLIPVILDIFFPLEESRSRILIFNGDILIDHLGYFKVYLIDIVCCWSIIIIVCAIDTMYAVVVEHCVAFFAIIQYRLNFCTKLEKELKPSTTNVDQVTYTYITGIIKLHKEVISFTSILEKSYKLYFLLEIGGAILTLSITAAILLIQHNDAFTFARFSTIIIGLLIHLFFLTLPGQKLINSSSNLFLDTYLNNWYNLSQENKNLLKFMSLRCSTPCQLTAAGLYVMNFINFAAIVKVAASYITVFSSFR